MWLRRGRERRGRACPLLAAAGPRPGHKRSAARSGAALASAGAVARRAVSRRSRRGPEAGGGGLMVQLGPVSLEKVVWRPRGTFQYLKETYEEATGAPCQEQQ
ncbi:unnamed protein product [Coccothraustes coccothraustes]